MGLLKIGNPKLMAGTEISYIQIRVYTETDDSVTVRFTDLILLPCDEIAMTVQPHDTSSALYTIAADAITIPGYRRGYGESSGDVHKRMLLMSSKDPQVQASAAQRIWMLFSRNATTTMYSKPYPLVAVTAEKQQRYLTFRGDD